MRHARGIRTTATSCPGLAYFNAQAGKRDVAMGYVKELRELDPDSAEYAQMAKQIEGAPPR